MNDGTSGMGFYQTNSPKRWNYCPHCVRQLPADWAFCAQCGSQIGVGTPLPLGPLLPQFSPYYPGGTPYCPNTLYPYIGNIPPRWSI